MSLIEWFLQLSKTFSVFMGLYMNPVEQCYCPINTQLGGYKVFYWLSSIVKRKKWQCVVIWENGKVAIKQSTEQWLLEVRSRRFANGTQELVSFDGLCFYP